MKPGSRSGTPLSFLFGAARIELDVPESDFCLRLLEQGDYESWRDIRLANREQLQPFEPTGASNALTSAYFASQVRIARREYDDNAGAMMLLIHRATNAVIGGINLRNVRRGVAQMGTLGYWIAHEWGGRGRMSQAVARMLRFGFEVTGLHRIEAACVPENDASARILLRNGFEEEGFAKAYLRINGEWRDHRLFAIVCSDDTESSD